MKSPFTGGETELIRQPQKLTYRKESFEIIYHSQKCVDTGEYFTNEALDRINIRQVHNQYREKHHIPFPDQIRATRDKYGLSATKMSEILGFGVNTYRNYEKGEVPQASNGKLIRMAANPEDFNDLLEMSDAFSENKQKQLLDKVNLLIEQEKDSDEELLLKLLSYKSQFPNSFSGYREMTLEKFLYMIIFFASRIKPFKTKLNKLLFYADFINYKKTCFSISGCNYKAIDLGPVPKGYDTLFEFFSANNKIIIDYIEWPQWDNVGEQFLENPDHLFDKEVFNEDELESLQLVVTHFKDEKTKDLIENSHKERAWKENEKQKGFIAYDYAFDLSIG
jgi:putative zinc finger/helix-turn-helix YgiT family protein